MNVLFLTMVKTNVEQRGIYSDLMRRFRDESHNVYIVMPTERRDGKSTNLKVSPSKCSGADGKKIGDVYTLSVRTLNVQKTNVIEKGLGQVSLECLYMRAIKKHFCNVKFDIITYSTPPITFTKVIEWAKKNNPSAITYLLLKDIFPQNAVDLGMLNTTGLKGLLYNHFRKKEEKLYRLSDYIGCMSPANVKYVLDHNPEVSAEKVEICPNSVELEEKAMFNAEKVKAIREKYNLPTNKPILIYGGNMGVPQGIPFLIECLEANKKRTDCHFVVVGSGTYYPQLAEWYSKNQNTCVTVMKELSKEDYDCLVQACNIGLIFLDYRFTIPNFPSRLLSYLEYKMPIIACTDPNCDTGTIASENGFGLWAPSNNVNAFTLAVNKMLAGDIVDMGNKGYEFLKENYLVDNSYNAIMKHL